MSKAEEKIWKKIWKEGNNQGFDMNETDAHNVFVAIKPLIQSYADEQNKKEAEENVKVEYELGLKVSRLEAKHKMEREADEYQTSLRETEIRNLESKLKEAEEQNKELIKLLKVARCTDETCDQKGNIPCQNDKGYWCPTQCQWCDDRKKLLNQ